MKSVCTDGDIDWPRRQDDLPVDEQARTQASTVGNDCPRYGRLRIASADWREVVDLGFDRRTAVANVDGNSVPDPDFREILPEHREIDPHGGEVGDCKNRPRFRCELTQRAVAVDHGAVDRCFEFINGQALVALDAREHIVFLSLVAQPLAHAADDAGEAWGHLDQGLLVGLHRAIQLQNIAQFPGTCCQQLDTCGRHLRIGELYTLIVAVPFLLAVSAFGAGGGFGLVGKSRIEDVVAGGGQNAGAYDCHRQIA